MHARTRPTLYAQLEALPDGVTGEILDGQLYAHPRPSGPHGLAATSLAGDLVNPFQKGRGGPGGWWIIAEPELHFIRGHDRFGRFVGTRCLASLSPLLARSELNQRGTRGNGACFS